MSAIETCRTAALGGHIEGCEDRGKPTHAISVRASASPPSCIPGLGHDVPPPHPHDRARSPHRVPAAGSRTAKLFRRLFLVNLQQLHDTGRIEFFRGRIGLSDRTTFRYKDYRRDAADRQRTMTLSPDKFIRCFPRSSEWLPPYPHYGLLASAGVRSMSLVPGSCSLRRRRLRSKKPRRHRVNGRPPCPCCSGRRVGIANLPACRSGACAPSSPPFTSMWVS
jgi:hypothetical protein